MWEVAFARPRHPDEGGRDMIKLFESFSRVWRRREILTSCVPGELFFAINASAALALAFSCTAEQHG